MRVSRGREEDPCNVGCEERPLAVRYADELVGRLKGALSAATVLIVITVVKTVAWPTGETILVAAASALASVGATYWLCKR